MKMERVPWRKRQGYWGSGVGGNRTHAAGEQKGSHWGGGMPKGHLSLCMVITISLSPSLTPPSLSYFGWRRKPIILPPFLYHTDCNTDVMANTLAVILDHEAQGIELEKQKNLSFLVTIEILPDLRFSPQFSGLVCVVLLLLLGLSLHIVKM